MNLDFILPAQRIAAMTKAGYWHDRTIIDCLDAAAAELPDKVALTDWNSMTGRATTLSYRQLQRLSKRLGAGLAALGVGKGDVVSLQLPSWWQFIALHLAAVRIGAITNPLMPIFRERELLHMLGLAETTLLVIPHRFRNFDYPGMVAGIRDSLPALQRVLVVGGEGESSFEDFAARRWEDETDTGALFASRRQGPNEVMQILYTSGTTGEAKGVMHSANTLLAHLVESAKRLNLSEKDVFLMGSPLAHQTGFLYGLMMPILLKAKAVLLDVWAAERAAQLIQDEACTFTLSATPFLSDLTDLETLDKYDISSFRIFACGGAPVPAPLVPRAAKRLGCSVLSVWGMSENGAPTVTKPDDPIDKVSATDGCALPGMEVKVVDADGQECPRGVAGDLKLRGASLFVGYLKRPQLYAVDAEGWFDTGDCARMDADGYIRITGRSKDVIIRGGENIPVVEVEGMLYGHPAIQDVAVVAMPDLRLGERACAFVVLRTGAGPLTLADVNVFLDQHKIAKQYYPERLEIVDELPRTATGKILKFKLREIAAQFTAHS